MEYYVVESYNRVISSFAYEIKKIVSSDDNVIFVSDSYQCCKEFIEGFTERVLSKNLID